MPIRFYCQRCDQLLGIATRKAGTQIGCPECGFTQNVPSKEAAAAAVAMTRSTRTADPGESTSQVVAYGEPGEPELSWLAQIETPEPIPPPAPGPARPSAAWEPDRTIPSGMILYRRKTLYIQGLLILLVVGGAFAAGYFVGRGDTRLDLEANRRKAAGETVLLEGKLYYDTGGAVAGDSGAVMFALPAEEAPRSTLSIEGIRPNDPPPSQANKSIRMIEDLGGVCQRVDDSGVYTVVLPKEGKYWVLFISRQTTRPAETEIDELDLSQMRKYFYRAAALVGPYKYHWTLHHFTAGAPPIDHNFGRDGEA